MTPRAPAVAPTPPPLPIGAAVKAKKFESEPPATGWDAAEADTATSFPEPAPTPRVLPPVKGSPPTQGSPPTNVPATPHSPGTVRGPYQTSPGVGGPPPDTMARVPALPAVRAAAASTTTAATAAHATLGPAMREEVWAIVRAAVDEAVSPLLARNRELEARVERAERFAEAAKSAGRSLIGAGIPAAATALASPVAAAPELKVPAAAAMAPPAALLQAPGSYGVTVMPSMRPSLDLESVGAVDISGFDGGRSKRRVATAVVVIMLLIVASVVTMTLLSHS